MEKSVLSTTEVSGGRESSVQRGPRRAAFWVVARTGMERISAALSSFWVVDMLGGVSDVAWVDEEGGKGEGYGHF